MDNQRKTDKAVCKLLDSLSADFFKEICSIPIPGNNSSAARKVQYLRLGIYRMLSVASQPKYKSLISNIKPQNVFPGGGFSDKIQTLLEEQKEKELKDYSAAVKLSEKEQKNTLKESKIQKLVELYRGKEKDLLSELNRLGIDTSAKKLETLAKKYVEFFLSE